MFSPGTEIIPLGITRIFYYPAVRNYPVMPIYIYIYIPVHPHREIGGNFIPAEGQYYATTPLAGCLATFHMPFDMPLCIVNRVVASRGLAMLAV